MRYRLGRLLQVMGMLIAPIGMVGNLVHPDTISETHILTTLFVGACTFGVGRMIQGPTRA
jgi:hypothetical protein